MYARIRQWLRFLLFRDEYLVLGNFAAHISLTEILDVDLKNHHALRYFKTTRKNWKTKYFCHVLTYFKVNRNVRVFSI